MVKEMQKKTVGPKRIKLEYKKEQTYDKLWNYLN